MSNAITATQLVQRGFAPNQFYRGGGVGGIANAFPNSGGHVLKSSSNISSSNSSSSDASNSSSGGDIATDFADRTSLMIQATPPSPFAVIVIRSGGNDTDVTDNKTREITNLLSPVRTPVIYYTMTDKYHREDERLKTFEHWPLIWLDKNTLAMTGMFYVGEDDKVKCYFCEVEIGRWDPDDQPLSEHMRWSPNCPLLRRRTTNNVPINQEALDRALPPQSYDVCGMNDSIEVRPRSYAENSIGVPFVPPLNLSAAPATTCFPEYPEYAIETARVRSFSEWPRHMKQKPEQLAEAGFFYTGTGDRVKCFSCGGGLKDWNENDEPWEQHAVWLNNCRFLKLMKDQQFIDEAIAKQKAHDAAEAAAVIAANQAADAAAAVTEMQIATEQSAPPSEATFCGNAMTAMCAMSTTPTPSVATATAPVLLQQQTALHAATNGTITTQPQSGVAAIAAACDNRADLIVSSDASNTITTTTTTALTKTTNTTNIPEEKLCKICYAGEYNTAFLPCGHVVACAKCASSVTKCPLCRKPFTDVMRVYFS